MKKIILISILFFFIVPISHSQESRNMSSKERHLRTIFNKIVEQVHDGEREKPDLILDTIDSLFYVAICSPENGKIYFQLSFINYLDKNFSNDKDKIIAYILGHEIVHHYKHKGFAQGIAFTKNQSLKNDSLQLTIEKEADLLGGMYAYMAGYDVREIHSNYMNAIYDTLSKIRKESIQSFDRSISKNQGYFPLEIREQIHKEISQVLTNFKAIYDAGNYLYITGNYEDAIKCFEHISQSYPSKDIYNNIGNCYIEMHLKAFSKEQFAQFRYPFTFEEKPHFYDWEAKSIQTTESDKAKVYYKKAIARDKEYWKAYINLASVYVIENKIDSANIVLNQINANPNDTNLIADINIVSGIAYAIKNDTSLAKECFELAKVGNKTYAEINLNVLARKAMGTGEGEDEISSILEKISNKTKEYDIKLNSPKVDEKNIYLNSAFVIRTKQISTFNKYELYIGNFTYNVFIIGKEELINLKIPKNLVSAMRYIANDENSYYLTFNKLIQNELNRTLILIEKFWVLRLNKSNNDIEETIIIDRQKN